MVIWITGLSGAGKTCIAREVVRSLREQKQFTVLLDGDDVRVAINDPSIGYDRESRLINAWRICRFAKLLADQGLIVIIATMSLFKDVHAWNRANLPGYFEVYVKVSLDTLRRRDARGLYSRAHSGQTTEVVGIHLDYDEPQTPDLEIENNTDVENFSDQAQQILSMLHTHLS